MAKLERKVLFFFGDSLESGGARTRIISELENLSDNSENIKIIHLCKVLKYKKYRKIRTLKIKDSKFDFRVIPKFPNAVFPPLRILSNLINILLSTIYLSYTCRIKNINLVHCHGMFPIFYSLPFKKITNSKLIFDCHGIIPEEEFYGIKNKEYRIGYRILKIIEKIVIKNSDLIITVSNKMSNHLNNIWSSVLFVMPMCVNTDFSFALEHRYEIRKKLGISNKKVIVYAGSLTEHQCPEEMFSLFKKLHDFNSSYHFLLMVPKNYLDKAKRLSNNLQKGSFTVLSVKRVIVPFLLSASDIGLMLRKESLVNQVSSPTKMSEYLASGLPVITTKYVGDSSDLINKNKVGIILQSDLNNVSKNMIKEIAGLTDRKFSERCFKCVKNERLWSSYISNLVTRYNQI